MKYAANLDNENQNHQALFVVIYSLQLFYVGLHLAM